MITITVEGSRGEGKTVTALRIVACLRSMGFDVKYESRHEISADELLRRSCGVLGGREQREFVVKDLT